MFPNKPLNLLLCAFKRLVMFSALEIIFYKNNKNVKVVALKQFTVMIYILIVILPLKS